MNADAKHNQLTAVVQHELVAVTGPGGQRDASTVGVGEYEREAREVGRLPVGQLEDCAPADRGSGLGDRRTATGPEKRLS